MSLLNRELDYFLAICETRNLARAAEALGVSQPALTRSLQRLEARFAARLFVRAPRGVELTPIGSALRARVENARTTLNDAEREVGQLAAGKIGKLRVGAGHLWARLVSQALFPRFIVERPAAQVQFHVAFNPELFSLVEAGSLDLALCGHYDPPPPSLIFRELFNSEMAVVVRNGHPLAAMRKPTIRDLPKFRGAGPGAGVRLRQIAEERLTKLGFHMQPLAMETNSWEAILYAVATTDLYSLAPVHEVLGHAEASRLVFLDIPELNIRMATGVVTRADAYLSPLAIRAIELVELHIAENERKKFTRPTRAGRAAAA
jgi:DNA-binding transcriptional LysR family regulator